MNFTLCHGSSKRKEQVGFKENKSMIFMYLVQGESKTSDIYKRKQTYKKPSQKQSMHVGS